MNAVEALRAIPAEHGSRDFLIDARTGESIDFDGFDRAARGMASGLRRRGLGRGDRVAIVLDNSPSFATLYLGCLYAGLVAVPVNPALAPVEVDFILSHSGAAAVVASEQTEPLARGAGAPTLAIAELETVTGGGEGVEPLAGADPEDTLCIVYTSGTTGRPAGIVHRIASLVGNARLFNRALGIGPQNRFYGILPMSYLGGYYNLLLLPYLAGASVVVSSAFDARSALDFWRPAAEHGVNTLWLVPTIASIVMEVDRGSEGERFCRERVERTLIGTAPLPGPLRRDFEHRYGVSLLENYGLSETLFLTSNLPGGPAVEDSVGRTLEGIEVELIDEGGEPVRQGQEGEIRVRTPYLMEGRLDPDVGAPDPASGEDWFPTGDVGALDESGNLFVTGRRKDLIIRGGINVSPAAIENVVLEHPAVAECAVVGVPHVHYGEEVAAVVRLAPGAGLEAVRPELASLCRERLGAASRPARIVEVPDFPRSSSGKIQKAMLRESLQEGEPA